MFSKFKHWNTWPIRPVELYLSFKRFCFYYSFSWKHSYPDCSSYTVLAALQQQIFALVFFSQPLFVTLLVTIVNEQWNICDCVMLGVSVTSFILCAVSLLTLTAISVDRLLALLLGLRYKHIVTLKRTCMIIATFWLLSNALSAMSLVNPLMSCWCIWL